MACHGLVLSGFALRCADLYWHNVVLAGRNRLGGGLLLVDWCCCLCYDIIRT